VKRSFCPDVIAEEGLREVSVMAVKLRLMAAILRVWLFFELKNNKWIKITILLINEQNFQNWYSISRPGIRFAESIRGLESHGI
jgi:hypothetical protein